MLPPALLPSSSSLPPRRYGFEALVVNEFGGLNSTSGKDVIRSLGMNVASRDLDIAALAAWFLFYRVIAYLVLRFKIIEKR